MPRGAGIDDAVSSQYATRIEHAVATDFGAVTDDGSELSQTRVELARTDAHILPIKPNVGTDRSSTKMRAIPKDGIADVVVMRCFDVVEEQAILELAGVAKHDVVPGDHILTDVGATPNGAIFTNPRGAFDRGVGLDYGASPDENVVANSG